MSTTAPSQTDPTSLDISGISTATGPPSDTNPRAGIVYDPVILAAAAPLWFHPMPDGTHLMINSRRWSAATPVGGGLFSAYDESLAPSWFVVHGSSGRRTSVPGFPTWVPVATNVDVSTLALMGAASRAPDHLYLLYSASIRTSPAALLQRIRLSPTGAVSINVEEVPPTVAVGPDTIVFDKGVQYDTPHLYLYGTDHLGFIYRMRKLWSHVGTTRMIGGFSNPGHMPVWEYFTGTGYSADPTGITPMSTTITTTGPMSFAAFKTSVLMSTCALEDADYVGHVWQTTSGRPWKPVGDPVPLGSTPAYLGGGVALQGELHANPAMLPPADTISGAIPYVVTTKLSDAGNDTLRNTWGLLPIIA